MRKDNQSDVNQMKSKVKGKEREKHRVNCLNNTFRITLAMQTGC